MASNPGEETPRWDPLAEHQVSRCVRERHDLGVPATELMTEFKIIDSVKSQIMY
jgi:hypothetical protein